MRKIAAIVATILMLVVGLRYSWLTWQGQIQPVLATWVLFLAAAFLSFMTYWSSKRHSIAGNIINVVDLFNVCLITFSILVLGKNIRLGFDFFELGCLLASVMILTFWKLSRKHAASNIALQVVMTIAYFPTFSQLWRATENSERFDVWILVWIASAIGLVPAYIDRDRLGMIYALRSLGMVSVILLLMLRINLNGGL